MRPGRATEILTASLHRCSFQRLAVGVQYLELVYAVLFVIAACVIGTVAHHIFGGLQVWELNGSPPRRNADATVRAFANR